MPPAFFRPKRGASWKAWSTAKNKPTSRPRSAIIEGDAKWLAGTWDSSYHTSVRLLAGVVGAQFENYREAMACNDVILETSRRPWMQRWLLFAPRATALP